MHTSRATPSRPSSPNSSRRTRRQLLAAASTGVAGVAAATALAPSTAAAHGDRRGGLFYPVDPLRVYDSRLATFDPSGILPPNSTRIVEIAHGCNSWGERVEHDLVPKDAIAVALTVTVASPDGPNFLSIAPSDAEEFASSTINFPGGFDIATGVIVKLGRDRSVKIFSGDQAGSTHVLIDATGFIA